MELRKSSFQQWRNFLDGHEEDNWELQKWVRTILQPFNISTTSLDAILHYQKLSENGVSHLLRRVHARGDGGVWERSRCVSRLELPPHQALRGV